MNLFQDETINLLLDLGFEENWAHNLTPYLSSNLLISILNKVKEERKLKKVYPEPEDVFKIFKLCPFDSIKVVIIGQDPYHNGNADGIAFSCKKELSPSLYQIYKAIEKDSNLETPSTKSLDYLVKQGVFLYNPILTVIEKIPQSHAYIGWKSFSDAVFNTIIDHKPNAIWLLWGRTAQASLTSALVSNGKKESDIKALIASHPASASHNKTTWQCDHFSKVNEYLRTNNLEEIKWL